MITLIAAAALAAAQPAVPAPATPAQPAPMAQHDMHMPMDHSTDRRMMDCCKECCKHMDAAHDAHAEHRSR